MTLDYHPLTKGLTLTYAYVGHDEAEPQVSKLVWRVEESSGGVARVSLRWDKDQPRSSEVRADARGVWTDGVLDIKLPPRKGDEWRSEDDYPLRRVLSLDAAARTLDREFTGCLEIGLTNEDTDSGRRLYAPGIGLVREDWSGESRNTTLVLVKAERAR